MAPSARAACFLALFCLGPVTMLRAGLFDWLFGRRELEVITVTDVTPDGWALRSPTPEDPVYYMTVSLGFHQLGGVMGGDKIPPTEIVLQMITSTLGKQGYLPATHTSPPPTLVLVLTWGTLNARYSGDEFNPDIPPRLVNRQQILRFIGGYKLGFSDADFDPLVQNIAGLTFMSPDSEKYFYAAENDYYIAMVSAYDLKALRQHQTKKLWTTRISCPSNRYWLDEVLPTMMDIAGPHIGRSTDRPVWVRASEKYRTEVIMADLQFLETLGSDPLPVIEARSTKIGLDNNRLKNLPDQNATSARDDKAAAEK